MLDGWSVDGLDQTGLSQKAGPVVSDLTLTRERSEDRAKLVGEAQADSLLAFDQLVSVSPATVAASSPQRTVTVASTSVTPVGAEISHPDLPHLSPRELEERLREASLPGGYVGVDAAKHASLLGGRQTTANLFVVGVAVQLGAVPVSPLRMREAIELNGVAVEANAAAFEWGRRWADNPTEVDSVMAAAAIDTTEVKTGPLPTSLSRRIDRLLAGLDGSGPEEMVACGDLAGLLTMLTSDLVAYQNAAYAHRFIDLVGTVAAAEQRVTGRAAELTTAVAQGYHKLLAYKDEYEVARLMLSEDGLAAVRAAGGSPGGVTWHLHPPALRAAGRRGKIRFGPWSRPVFVALARSNRLRGTRLDPFGRTDIRRLERQLPVEYAAAIAEVAQRLTAGNLDEAVALAALPEMVRGFESLKLRRAADYRARLASGLAVFGRSSASPVAAT